MELVPIRTVFGEEKSWDEVCGLDPVDISARTGCAYEDQKGYYVLPSFGVQFQVRPCSREIDSNDSGSELFLGKLKDFFRLSVLGYFMSGKDIPLSERLVRPTDLKGGQRFSTGTHVLPTEMIAGRFGRDPDGFVEQAKRFGGHRLAGYGDVAVRLYPLPRVPVTLLLWLEDEEFPPRVDLFFDSTCNFQIALSDIVWAVAMMSALVMLE